MRPGRRAWVLAAGIVVVVLLASSLGYGYLDRFASSFDPRHGTARFRIYMWTATLRMIRSAPWLGVGAGNFRQVYPLFRDPKEEKYSGENIFVEKAHNDHLHQWAEQGLPGLFVWLYLLAMIGFTGFQVLVRRDGWRERPVAAAAFLALVGTLVHGFFSFNLTASPAPTLLFFLCLGLLAGPAAAGDGGGLRRLRRITPPLPVPARAALGALLAALLVHAAAVVPLRAAYHLKAGETLMKAERIDEAIPELELAARIRPHNYKTFHFLGYCRYQAGQYREAIQAFKTSMALYPNYRNNIFNLAHVYEALANAAERRLKAAPYELQRRLAREREQGGTPEEQRERESALRNELQQQIEQENRRFWALLQRTAETYERALDLDARNLSARNNLLLIYRRLGRIQRSRLAGVIPLLARAAGFPLPPGFDQRTIEEYLAVHQRLPYEQKASALLEESLELHPFSPDLHNNRGVIAFTRQDYAAALESFRRVLELRNTIIFSQSTLNHYALLGTIEFRIGAVKGRRWIIPFGKWGRIEFSAGADAEPRIVNSDRGGTFSWDEEHQVLTLVFEEAPGADRCIVEYRTRAGSEQVSIAKTDLVYAMAANNAGRCLELLGKPDEAEAMYREASRLDPTYASPVRNLALLRLGRNPDDPEGRKLLQRLQQLDPDWRYDPRLREAGLVH